MIVGFMKKTRFFTEANEGNKDGRTSFSQVFLSALNPCFSLFP